MKVFVPFLFTLIQLCICGDDKKEAGRIDNREQQTHEGIPLDNLSPGATASITDEQENDTETCLDEGAAGPKEEPKAPLLSHQPPDQTINVAIPDPNLCQSFDYHYNGVPIRLVVPKRNAKIGKLTEGRKEIWATEDWEKFEYSKICLKNGIPELALVTTSTSSGTRYRRYVNTWRGWKACDEFGTRLESLKVVKEHKYTFSLDISTTKATVECTSFETMLLGAPMILHYPEPGYTAKEVVYGRSVIWKGNGDEICLACDAYLEGDEPSFVIVIIEDKGYVRLAYFVKRESGWKTVEEQEFSDLVGLPVVYTEEEQLTITKRESGHSYLRRLFSFSSSQETGTRRRVPSDPGRYEEEEKSLVESFMNLFSREQRAHSSEEVRSRRPIVKSTYKDLPPSQER